MPKQGRRSGPTTLDNQFRTVLIRALTSPVIVEFYLAYIDPGSGSMLLQLLIAGIVGTLTFFRSTVARVVGFVLRRKPKDTDSSDPKE